METTAKHLAVIAKLTSGHKPGEPYALTRRAFALFAGLCIPVTEDWDDDKARRERAAFWAEIASFEAARWFNDWQRCRSQLSISSYEPMRWEYETTSSSLLEAKECREDGEGTTPPRFTVTIPAERDLPGRYAWRLIRLAMVGFGEAQILSLPELGGSSQELEATALYEALRKA